MKKSFILHIDSLCILDKMTNEQAGTFIKIIYEYQKTKILPEMDLLMEMAITPFINQFFRDEKGYERVLARNSENGKKGGRPKKEPKKPSRLKITHSNPNNPEEPKKADSDSVNDSDSVSVSKREEGATPTTPQKTYKQWTTQDFIQELEQFKPKFSKDLLNSFYKYWSEKSPTGKMKLQLKDTWETAKRLDTWQKKEEGYSSINGSHVKTVETFNPALKNKLN